MKNLFKLSLLLIVLMLAWSCKKEEAVSAKPLSAEEAKSVLDNSTTDITSDISTVSDAPSLKALTNLGKMETPFHNPFKSLMKSSNAEQLKDALVSQTSHFDFNGTKGEWQYNPLTKEIVKISASDKVIIHFPSDSSAMTVNDAVLTISSYVTIMKVNSSLNDTTYKITKLSMSMEIKSKKTLDIDFSADWNTNGMPKTLNITITLDDNFFFITYSKSSLQYALNTSFKKSGNTIFASNANVTFSSDSSKMPEKMNGYVQIRDIKLQGYADMKNYFVTTYKASDFNANIHMDVLRASDGAKIGTIKAFDEIVEEKEKVVTYIVFNDGSKEPAKKYLDKFYSGFHITIHIN